MGPSRRVRKLADAILQHSPNDRNALFATVLNLGLESDYLALVEKRDLAALAATKRAGLAAEKLLAVDPACYDAYLAIGVENYILGLNPAPVRWLLRLYGAETDKESGIQKLQLTATKGHYLLPFARLLLAVAALRDKRSQPGQGTASESGGGISQQSTLQERTLAAPVGARHVCPDGEPRVKVPI